MTNCRAKDYSHCDAVSHRRLTLGKLIQTDDLDEPGHESGVIPQLLNSAEVLENTQWYFKIYPQVYGL